MATYEFSSVAIYVLAFIGAMAMFSGIWGIFQYSKSPSKSEQLNCLELAPTASPSCANAKLTIMNDWGNATNQNIAYSASIFVWYGLVLSGLTYYMYKSKLNKTT